MKKPIIFTCNILITIITFGFARGITLYPFVLLKYKTDLTDKRLINHETIHFHQQKELSPLKFYYYYLRENSKLTKIYGKGNAYRKISFEKEAFANDHNLEYLETRPKNAWKNYIDIGLSDIMYEKHFKNKSL